MYVKHVTVDEIKILQEAIDRVATLCACYAQLLVKVCAEKMSS